jgi:hypothetical protein
MHDCKTPAVAAVSVVAEAAFVVLDFETAAYQTIKGLGALGNMFVWPHSGSLSHQVRGPFTACYPGL